MIRFPQITAKGSVEADESNAKEPEAVLKSRMKRSSARMICTFACLSLIAWCLEREAIAQWPTPRVDTILPCGGQPGTQFEVTIGGTELEELSALEFSHPGIQAIQKVTPATEFMPERPVNQVFTITIAEDVPSGIYEARVRGRFGISNPRRFEVAHWVERSEAGNNNAYSSAMPIQKEELINGRLAANAEDFYRLPVAAGESIVIECRAQSIDSKAMVALKLYDSNGNELLRARDARGGDPVLVYQAAEATEVIIGVRDFLFKGSDHYFYRLVAHTRPYLAYAWPPVVPAGDNPAEVEVFGWNLPDGKPHADAELFGFPLQSTVVQVSPAELAEQRPTTFVSPISFAFQHVEISLDQQGGPSNRLAIFTSDLPVHQFVETGNHDSDVFSVDQPAEVVGRFEPGQDVDRVSFQATKDQVLWIEVFSQQLGSATDPEILIQRVNRSEDGQITYADIAAVDDPGNRNGSIGGDFDLTTDDPSYRLTVPEDGEYRVSVKNLFSASDEPRDFYRLRIRPERPDFVAVARPVVARPGNGNQVLQSSLVFRRGETRRFDVEVLRQDGFQGLITIEARGLPDGVECDPVKLPESMTRGPLMIDASESVAAWDGEIQLVAIATVGDLVVEKPISIGTTIWGTGNRTVELPRFRLTDRLPMTVLDFETNPITIRDAVPAEDPRKRPSELGAVYETSRGGSIEVKLSVQRRNEFNAAFQLTQVGLPGQFGVNNFQVPENATEVSFTLNANNNALQPGWYRFHLQGDVKWSHQKNPGVIPAAQAEQTRLNELLQQLTAKVTEQGPVVQSAEQALNEVRQKKQEAETAHQAAMQEQAKADEMATMAASNLTKLQAELEQDPENETLQSQVAEAQQGLDGAKALAAQRAELTKQAEDLVAQVAADVTAAEALLKEKQDELAELQADQATVQNLKNAADQALNAANNAYKPYDLTETMVSRPIYVRLVASPITLQAENAEQTVGQVVEIPITIERQYGFAANVDVVAQLPNNVGGATPMKLTLAPEASEGILQITTTENTPAGTYAVTLKATGRFNNINVETTSNIQLELKPVESTTD